jgi:hypothetical protein
MPRTSTLMSVPFGMGTPEISVSTAACLSMRDVAGGASLIDYNEFDFDKSFEIEYHEKGDGWSLTSFITFDK